MALTAKEIADAVWASKTVDPVTKKEVTMRTLIGFIRINASFRSWMSVTCDGASPGFNVLGYAERATCQQIQTTPRR